MISQYKDGWSKIKLGSVLEKLADLNQFDTILEIK